MAIRFYRRIPLIPGLLYLNISKGGISFSLRRPGVSVTAGNKGVTTSVGLPGTGLSYRKKIGSTDRKKNNRQLESDTLDKMALLKEKMNGKR